MEAIETIALKFEGNSIRPSAVKASEIADLIKSLEASLLAIAKKKEPEINEDLVNISFEEIKESSLLLRLKPHIAVLLTAAVTLGASFESKYFDDYSTGTLEHLKVFTRFAKRHNCTGYIYKGSEQIGTFDKETDVKYSDKGTVSGETTVYGEVKRAGGDNPKVTLRINNEYTLSFDVSKEIAIQLASNLYKEVGLVGKARWDKRSFKILEFSANEVILLDEEPLTKSFGELSDFFSNDDLDNLNLIV